jgi:hypothetical protein
MHVDLPIFYAKNPKYEVFCLTGTSFSRYVFDIQLHICNIFIASDRWKSFNVSQAGSHTYYSD